ncbi:hypothetical protein ABZW30_29810 [Kitasatospora sp. NPDC004669]|uniref:hypothetical protein n=1 Tax=Kitasatospora sp. NPDC004669 TaxID=3154555 RepID=UPI0033AB5964
MQRVLIDRSNPDVLDLVLVEQGGSLRYALATALQAVIAAPVLFLYSVLFSLPLYIVMLFAGTGWGPVWAAAGIAGGAGAVIGWALLVRLIFRHVHRLRFTPSAEPTAVALVRGARADRPMPITEVRRIRIDHSTEEPYDGDPRPRSVTITVTVLLEHGKLPQQSLPQDTDTTALHRELYEALSPGVAVDLHVHHHQRPEPPPPPPVSNRPGNSGWWSAIGHGGSTGGGGGG